MRIVSLVMMMDDWTAPRARSCQHLSSPTSNLLPAHNPSQAMVPIKAMRSAAPLVGGGVGGLVAGQRPQAATEPSPATSRRSDWPLHCLTAYQQHRIALCLLHIAHTHSARLPLPPTHQMQVSPSPTAAAPARLSAGWRRASSSRPASVTTASACRVRGG